MKSLLIQRKKWLSYFSFVYLIAVSFLGCDRIIAQTIPDGSLPNNTEILIDGDTIKINGGTTVGNNLFHSFEGFSIPANNTALFNNDSAIVNILTRITGNSISYIDGLIRANGAANLFLINPNGILFGENAALDIGGSFIGTTADSISFGDESQFSAKNPKAPPLLAINIPVGLQFGSNPGDIIVQGNGHNAFLDLKTLSVNLTNRNKGLEVLTGKTLGLIGNNVLLDGGNVTAERGNIELGSAAKGRTIELIPNETGWTLNYEQLGSGNIDLVNESSVDVGGNGSGSVQIQGDTFNVINHSAIFAINNGNTDGGAIHIKAKNIKISNQDNSSSIPQEGDAVFRRDDIFPVPSSVGTIARGLGDGGNISITADKIEISETGQIAANTFNFGRSGNISITTKQLTMNDGTIGATTFGSGDGGSVYIDGNDISVNGSNALGASGIFASAVQGTGSGGDIKIKSDRLTITNGANINVSNFFSRGQGKSGTGRTGTIDIETNYLELDNNTSGFPSTITASSNELAGGDITLNVDRNIALKGNSEIVANTRGGGDGGSIKINTSNFKLTNEARVAVNGSGVGKAGDLEVFADRITLTDGANFSAKTISGQGGNINLQITDLLALDHRAAIQTDALDLGNGGNINIDTKFLITTNNSIISAQAISGQGGNINILATDLFVSSDSLISASATAELGIDGEVEIETFNMRDRHYLSLLPETIIEPETEIASYCGGNNRRNGTFSYIGRGGMPSNPLTGDRLGDRNVLADFSLPLKSEFEPTLETDLQTSKTRKLHSISPLKIIEAANWKVNRQGKVELLAEANLISQSGIVTNSRCPLMRG